MTMSADGTRAYIVDYNNVTVLCTLTLEVIDTITIDARPSCVAVDSEGGRVARGRLRGRRHGVLGRVDHAAAVLAVHGDGPHLRARDGSN